MVNGKFFCFIILLFLCFNNSSGLSSEDFDTCSEVASISSTSKRKDGQFKDCIAATPSDGYRCCVVSHKVSKELSKDNNRWHHSCELFIKDSSFIKHYKKHVALKDVHIECGSKYLSVAMIFLISLLIF